MPLSYSQLKAYQTCPKQYEYAFVEKIERPLSPAETFGVSVHSVLKRWGELEMRNTKETSDGRLTLFTNDHHHETKTELSEVTLLRLWRECFVGAGYASRTEEDAALRRGEEALKKFYAWWRTKERTVLAVEKGFKLPIPGKAQVLSGRFDRVEADGEGLVVIDYKTGSPIDQDRLDADVQLSIYALAAADIWKKPVTSLVLLSVQDEACTPQVTTRNPSQLRDAIRMIEMLEEGIESGDFRPTPSLSKCKRCPYREICPASVSSPLPPS